MLYWKIGYRFEVYRPAAPNPDASPAGSASTWKVAVGTASIVLWGLFFEQLTGVASWVLDTSNTGTLAPLIDLRSRYLDAHLVLAHLNLYAYRPGAFTYPPITAYLFVPFRAIGWHATEIVWTVANLVGIAALVWILLWRFLGVRKADAWLYSAVALGPALVFLLYPFRSLIFWGQLSLFLVLAIVVDLFCIPKRYRGLLIGVATAIKLLPIAFVVWFLARREIPGILRMAASFLLLTLLAVVLWPHASAEYWFHLLPSGKDVHMIVDPTNLPTTLGRWYNGLGKVGNQSIRGLLARPPFEFEGSWPWLPIAALVGVVGVASTYRLLRAHRELAAFVLLSLTTVYVSPVSWLHYWVFVGIVPFLALLEWRRDRPLAVASIVLAVSTCANLEDPRLVGVYLSGAEFDHMSSIVIFVVRNLYVLGGAVFFVLATYRAWNVRDTLRVPGGESEDAAVPATA